MEQCWEDFDVQVARWRLGDLMAESLPAAALEAEMAGCDSPSLKLLVGHEGSGWSEIEPVVAKLLEERGQELPTEEDAANLVVHAVLQDLVARKIDPQVATSQLADLAWRFEDELWEDLNPFVFLRAEWQDADEGLFDPNDLRDSALREANQLLDRRDVGKSA